uniref:NADH-ubiquinone oxidoreductase chain 4 n=1 Tax=Wasmannia auropunctata TaxID=64793 RepID=A0A191TFT6_WASAN|nr:NADH dehydrogenase subunit 4 [Wasmannia auropunctata]ANI87497.1 NADH dehydrogenase subunit 4 [Wasmannia auropunctata]
MMKFVLMVVFMNFMLVKNFMIMFYYNLCYLISFFLLFMYMFKDMLYSVVGFYTGMEYYSFWLVVLSFWIVSLMFMSLEDKINFKKMNVILILLLVLVMFFISLDMMMFYFMFEVSLIPTFFLIVYWGVNPERFSASYYLMVYMLLISFPLLVYIFNIYIYSGSLKFSILVLCMDQYEVSVWGFMMIYLAFYIKMPMYMFHVWLPKAHVEAPVYGSMILAGVLLKMGGYGLIRFMEILINMSIKFNFLIMSVSIVGSLIVSLICLVQIDMKSLVAYSSVVHMNMMLCGMLSMTKMGIVGGYIMMIAHGLCSSGLFYMVNLYYMRSSSRLLMLNKGLMSKLPGLTLWWFLLCSANFSFPFSLNFISEILILMVVLNWDFVLLGNLMLICFFSSAYSLYLFSYVQHGGGSKQGGSFHMSMVKEYIVLIMHFFPLFMILLNLVIYM